MLLVFDVAYSLLSTCQETYPAATNHNDYQKNCAVFGGIIPWGLGIALIPVNSFLETYEHSLVAGFTIVLAFSTIGLWWSTSRLWDATKIAADAAKEAADHIPRVERAYLFIGPGQIGVRRKDEGSPVETT